MMATERRRNMYADSCRVCGAPVPAGEGWLYSDTKSARSRSRRRAGRAWAKFVKCARCHTLGAVRKSDLPENRPTPVVREKVGVGDLRRATFRLGWWLRHMPGGGVWRYAVVELVLPNGAAETVAQERPITGEPIGVGGSYGAGAPCFGGRILTPAAERELALLGEVAADLFAGWITDPRECE